MRRLCWFNSAMAYGLSNDIYQAVERIDAGKPDCCPLQPNASGNRRHIEIVCRTVSTRRMRTRASSGFSAAARGRAGLDSFSRPRCAVAHDLVLRALVAGQFALLGASLWVTFSGSSSRPVLADAGRPPAADATSARSVETVPVRAEPALEPAAEPWRVAPSASCLPLPFRARMLVSWPGRASGVFLAVYGAGLIVGLGAIVRAALRTASVRRAARPVADAKLARELACAAEQVGSRARIACLACDSAPGLALAGWRRKTILVAPALLERLSATEVRALLVHELCHGLRRDIAWQLGARRGALLTVAALAVPIACVGVRASPPPLPSVTVAEKDTAGSDVEIEAEPSPEVMAGMESGVHPGAPGAMDASIASGRSRP